MSRLGVAALDLAARGYFVFPLRPRGKEPLTARGFKDATRDERRILHWWDKWPDANIGIACGESRATVWDIDSKSGADHEDVLCERDVDGVPVVLTGEAPEPSPSHPDSLAGVRGAQLYFRGDLKGTNQLTVAGTEIRGKQHYVVGPGSVHPSGVAYEGQLPPVDELLPVPEWLEQMRVSTNGDRPRESEPLQRIIGHHRNIALMSLAGSMRRRGAEEPEILAALSTLNEQRCEPSLPLDEVGRVAASVCRYDPEEVVRSDLETAQQFAREHGARVRHITLRKTWLVWDGARWRRDASAEVARYAKQSAYGLLARAAAIDDIELAKSAAKWALSARSESRIRAALALAESEPEIAAVEDMFDAHPFLLSCPNGTLGLSTGELRAHDPADLLSHGTDVIYDADAGCPRWEQFLEEIFARDAELVGFVRRLVGYTLTGDTREHVLAVLHGTGCNGKTTFVETLKALLGSLAATASFDTFVRARGDRGPRNDLARLHRARLVIASESGEGRRLDEATVKQLTGGDTIAARFLFAEHFEFKPQFKLLLVTNNRPRVDGDDDAIWRRLRLIPFEQSFTGREDQELGEKLARELPGILAWAVRGCLEWQRGGLGSAGAVTRATAEYRSDEDVLGAFIAEKCRLDGEMSVGGFREAYESYCNELGEKPLTGSWLSRRLGKRGIRTENRNTGRTYVGVTTSKATTA